MWSALRSCLSVYLDLSPRGMATSSGQLPAQLAGHIRGSRLLGRSGRPVRSVDVDERFAAGNLRKRGLEPILCFPVGDLLPRPLERAPERLLLAKRSIE